MPMSNFKKLLRNVLSFQSTQFYLKRALSRPASLTQNNSQIWENDLKTASKHKSKYLLRVFSFYLALLTLPSVSWSQQTIFNVPSADITDKNRVYIQHEGQFRARDPNRFYSATNYATYGVGGNIELNATQFNLSSPASHNDSLGLGFKSAYNLKFVNNRDWKPKIIFGAMTAKSLIGNGTGGWIYSQGSMMIPYTSTRITGGVSSGSRQIFGEDTTCALGAVEQKVSSNLNLIADWYSGNHALGMLSAGFSYQFPEEVILFAGYQLPNSKKVGRNSLVFEIGKTF